MPVSRPISVRLPDYGVLFAESIHASDFQMSERTDAFHKLIYVLNGELDYREIDAGKAVAAKAGSLLIVPAGVAHRLADREASTLLLMCVTDAFFSPEDDLRQLWSLLTRLPGRRLTLSRTARQTLEGYWRRALVESAHQRPGGPTVVRALAAQAIVLLSRLPPQSEGASALERVAAVIRELEETFYEPWTLDRAAARAGLSRRRFTDLFRTTTGVTFGDFLNRQRLGHAARLLRRRGHSIMGVMFSCGFNDVSHFYRLFRRHYGAAPRAWLAKS